MRWTSLLAGPGVAAVIRAGIFAWGARFLWINPHLGRAPATDIPAVPALEFEAAGCLIVALKVEASFDLTTLSLVDPGLVAFAHDY